MSVINFSVTNFVEIKLSLYDLMINMSIYKILITVSEKILMTSLMSNCVERWVRASDYRAGVYGCHKASKLRYYTVSCI